jgi:energy-coupling factor transporter ATP-binding protein EcfA2
MPLAEDIAEWSASRPPWQQDVLHRLAGNSPLGEEDIRAIARELASGRQPAPNPLAASDLPGGGGSGVRVRLRSVQPVEHVNALLDGQVLSFAPVGLTVVYGDNASGKSGYARLIKQVVRARHREDVLTDIFEDRAGDLPAAQIDYDIDQDAQSDRWPGDTNRVLRQVSFFDEACGETYVSSDSEVPFRPSALLILDGLIVVCDAVRAELDSMLVANAQRRVPLPALPEGSAIRAFVTGLTGSTTATQVNAASQVSANVGDEISELATEEARLRASDPTKEQARLTEFATNALSLVDHLAAVANAFGEVADAAILTAQQRATETRAAATVASLASFDTEPVSGVGSETWRSLWEAARRFSAAEAYPTDEFPVVETPGRCLLCQQEYAPDAARRMHRFHAFMADDTETQAAKAQQEFDDALTSIRDLVILPTAVGLALTVIERSDAELAKLVRSSLVAMELRKTAFLARVSDHAYLIPEIPSTQLTELRAAAIDATAGAAAVDAEAFKRSVADLATRRAELEGRRDVSGARDTIDQEILRLAERESVDAAKKLTDTTWITNKATDLARDHVTAIIRDRFTRESHDLKLEKVTLEDVGGKKGQLRHRPTFLGATQTADIAEVLSEGEQTALGLAGFLTETYFDDTHSAIVLDDPVSSLDHLRRDHVAKRLSEFARDRQVVVFTHDVAFVGDLIRGAAREGIDFTERTVERHGNDSIGICIDKHPWQVRDAKARLGQLEAELAVIKRERSGWDAETYEKETSDWAGKLSETWERIISLEIVSQVVDRGTLKVHPKMFRLFARITSDDDNEFQQSYERISEWARRHDKSPEVNYVAPDVTDMEAEFQVVRTWFERVKKYTT